MAGPQPRRLENIMTDHAGAAATLVVATLLAGPAALLISWFFYFMASLIAVQ